MCPVFFCADFLDGRGEGGCLMRSSDWGAVCGFGCGSRQNSVEKPVFCLLSGPREADLDAGVDKIR